MHVLKTTVEVETLAKPKLELLTEGYRLRVGETVTEPVDWGECLDVEIGGKKYMAFLDLPDNAKEGDAADSVESKLTEFLYIDGVGIPEEDVEMEDVADDDDDDDDDDDGEDED